MKISGKDVQDPLVSGVNIKTLNNQSLLGPDNIVVKTGYHIPTKPVTGIGYSNVLLNGNNTYTHPSGVLNMTPFIPANDIIISMFAIQVTTASAANTIKLVIFSDINGIPDRKIYESSLLDISTTGFKIVTFPYRFVAGTVYWLGTFTSSSTVALSANSLSIQIGSRTVNTSTFNALSYVLTYPTIPDTLTTLSTNYNSLTGIPRFTFIPA